MLSRRTAGLALLGVLGLLSFTLAGGPTKAAPPPDDKEVLSSKVVATPPAATVNFRKQLGLSYPSLGSLGRRIDAARRAHDPVAMAHLANELSVAESVSGKKASLTSKAVLKEASALAKLRHQKAELTANLKVAEQMAAEDEDIAALKASIASANAEADAAQESINQGLEPTWKPRKLLVNNYTTQYVDVYVNGNYKGQVLPGLARTFVIEHRWNPTVLTAYGDQDMNNWGPQYVWGRFDKYTWNIN